VQGFEVNSANAMFAPAGTPSTIVNRISEHVGKALKQTDVASILEKQGLQVETGTPEDLAALIATESARWARVIKSAGIALRNSAHIADLG